MSKYKKHIAKYKKHITKFKKQIVKVVCSLVAIFLYLILINYILMRFILILFILLHFQFLNAQTQFTDKLNLSFENLDLNIPKVWVAYGSNQYKFSVASNNAINGKYVAVIENTSNENDFKAISINLPHNYKGEIITLSGYIKTENITDGYAGLWMRIDPDVAFDNMSDRRVSGTTDWKKYEISLKLNPKETDGIVIGALLSGKGKMWIDDLKVAIDGKDLNEYMPDVYIEKMNMSVTPVIDQEKIINKEIIQTFRNFIESKNKSFKENKYWLKADFEKHKYSYIDLYGIDDGKSGKNFYSPTLMEIIATENSNQYIVKFAYIGHTTEKNENQLRIIYNFIANKIDGEIVFSRYQDYVLQKWEQKQIESITYYISPLKKINEVEVNKQLADIKFLCDFFETKPIPLTYISCVNPKELFEVKGFDYNPMMYVSKTGGFAEAGNIILSGNSSEVYTHEIVHVYTRNLFPNIKTFFDEGLATYLAGSGKNTYSWHKEKVKKFIQQNESFKVEEHMEDIYERLYFEEETPIPYLIAAIICDRTIRLYGKNTYFEILNATDDLWKSLEKVGLTKENINAEIRKELGN